MFKKYSKKQKNYYKSCKNFGPDGRKGCRTCCKKFKKTKKFKKCKNYCMKTKYKPNKLKNNIMKGGNKKKDLEFKYFCTDAGPDGKSGCRDCCKNISSDNVYSSFCLSDCMRGAAFKKH